MIASSAPGEADTVSTNPVPPWPRAVSSSWANSSAWAAERGSIHAPFSTFAAPAARSLRHSLTRKLDGEAGSWTRSSSQPDGPFITLIRCNTCFSPLASA